MTRYLLTLTVAAVAGFLVVEADAGVGPRGGGGGARGGGGGRPSMGAPKAPQRSPQRPPQRPSGGGARPGMGPGGRPQGAQARPGGGAGARPNAAQNRPQTNRPATPQARPNVAQNRPAGGGPKAGMVPQNRPNVAQNRPNAGGGPRPGFGPGGNTKPAQPGAGGGIAGNRPGAGGGGVQRPGIADNRPGPGGGINRPGGGGAAGNRPGIGDRPGPGGGINRPGAGDGIAGNRPGGIGDRPGPGGGIDRPGIGDRSGIMDNRPGPGGGINRPGIGDRPGPGGGINNRPSPGGTGDRIGGQLGDRATAIGSGNTTVNRPEVNVNNVRANNVQNVSNTFAQSNRLGAVNTNPYGGGYGGYGWNNGGYWNGYYGRAAWNSGWRSGYWSGYFNRPVGWYATAAPLGWLPSAAAASYVYSNPYYAAPAVSTTVVESPVYNYTQPIAAPPVEVSAPVDIPLSITVTGPQAPSATAPTAAAPAAPPTVDEQTEDAVNKDFTAAREAFMKGDYAAAQANAEKSIQAFPNDPSLHEFLSLVLFARAKFGESAGVVYAVLAAQPGWSYDTMRALYPDTETYTRQLRALESYQKANPTRGDACFLLAYHYLTLEYKDAAVEMLRQAVKNEPKDTLSAALLKALTEPPPAPPTEDGSKK